MHPKIMKTFQILFTFFVISSLYSQTINQEVRTEDGKQFLVGEISLEALSSDPYKSWYTANYQSYLPQQELLKDLRESLKSYHILVFLGTWCGDSKREVPRFVKILESEDYPMEKLKIVALDGRKEHYKKSPTGEEWGLQIKRVPTFIFLKDGKEVNRIVESPIKSLEEDILQIISQNSYTPNYADLMKSD